MIDLDELEKDAKACTTGLTRVPVTTGLRNGVLAELILSPEAVLALIERIRALEQQTSHRKPLSEMTDDELRDLRNAGDR